MASSDCGGGLRGALSQLSLYSCTSILQFERLVEDRRTCWLESFSLPSRLAARTSAPAATPSLPLRSPSTPLSSLPLPRSALVAPPAPCTLLLCGQTIEEDEYPFRKSGTHFFSPLDGSCSRFLLLFSGLYPSAPCPSDSAELWASSG